MTLGDNRDDIRVLLYSYYTTITGWGVLLKYPQILCDPQNAKTPKNVNACFHTILIPFLKAAPLGSKDPNNGVLGPKYYDINGIWALNPYYLGPWTLRGLYSTCKLKPRTLLHILIYRTCTKPSKPNMELHAISRRPYAPIPV